jgi:hypothetical protein
MGGERRLGLFSSVSGAEPRNNPQYWVLGATGLRYPALKVKRAGACPAAWGPALPAVKKPAKISTICRDLWHNWGDSYHPILHRSKNRVINITSFCITFKKLAIIYRRFLSPVIKWR